MFSTFRLNVGNIQIYYVEYCQSHITLLWIWIMLCNQFLGFVIKIVLRKFVVALPSTQIFANELLKKWQCIANPCFIFKLLVELVDFKYLHFISKGHASIIKQCYDTYRVVYDRQTKTKSVVTLQARKCVISWRSMAIFVNFNAFDSISCLFFCPCSPEVEFLVSLTTKLAPKP